MHIRTTQIIDYWVGIPLCLMLSLWRRFLRMFIQTDSRAPQKIVFIELSEMGSAIIAHSALAQTKLRFPNAELYFMVFSKNRESVSLLDIIAPEHLILIDEKTFFRFIVTTTKALLRLRSLSVDTIIDLELFSRFTAILSYLSGAERRIGFHNYTAEGLYRGSLLTHRVFYNPHQHMQLNFLALVLALSASPADRPMLKEDMRPYCLSLPVHRPSEEEVESIWKLLKEHNPLISHSHRLLVLNPDPGEALPIRGWPIERYESAVRQLLEINPDLFCVVIGLASSRPYAERIQLAIGRERVIDLTGRTKTLREVVTLFTQAHVLLTNDSGPAHFASLTNIRSVALYGPETPNLYGALGPGKRNISAGYSCSPCLSAHNHRHTICTDNKCLQALPESLIVSETQELLNQTR